MRDIRALIVQDVNEIDEYGSIEELLTYRDLAREGYDVALPYGGRAEKDHFTLTAALPLQDAVLFPGKYDYGIVEFILAQRFDTPVTVCHGDWVANDTCIIVAPHLLGSGDGWTPFNVRGAYKIYLRT